jgi:hypothetical protein
LISQPLKPMRPYSKSVRRGLHVWGAAEKGVMSAGVLLVLGLAFFLSLSLSFSVAAQDNTRKHDRASALVHAMIMMLCVQKERKDEKS